MTASPPRQKPYISTWVDRDDTWTTHTRLYDWDGNKIRTGTRILTLPGGMCLDESRCTQTREGAVLNVGPANAGSMDRGGGLSAGFSSIPTSRSGGSYIKKTRRVRPHCRFRERRTEYIMVADLV